MSYYHQLWEPAIASADIAKAKEQVETAAHIQGGTQREHDYIRAVNLLYVDNGFGSVCGAGLAV